jgi:formylglycine-generating enzyme required for sulfatase activity
MALTDTELLDALSNLLPAQFEAVLLRAKVPTQFLPSGVAPPATRAVDVVRWVRQDPTARQPLVAGALRAVHGPAGDSSAGLREPPAASIPTTPTVEAPMTASSSAPFRDFGLAPTLRAALDPIRELLHGPTRNAVFPVVGSGLSQGLISWRGLLEELIAQASPDEIDGLLEDLRAGKYIDVAGDLEADGRVGPTLIAKAIAKHFRQPAAPRPVTYDLLAKLPVEHFATTNFDPWLKDALAAARAKSPRVYSPSDPSAYSDLAPQTSLLVLMLHGDADRPEHCVLANRSYRELLHGHAAYRRTLEALVSQRTWLFVGHSFSDPDLATLFDAWGQVFGVGEPRHYLLKDAMGEREKRRLRERRIEHIEYGPAGDHSRLPDVLCYLAQPKPGTPTVAAPTGTATAATSAPSASSSALLSWERAYLGARRPLWQQGRHDVLAAKGFETSLADLHVPLNVTPQPWCHVDEKGRLVVRDPEATPVSSKRGKRGAQPDAETQREDTAGEPALAEQAATSAPLRFVVVQGEAGTGKTVLLQHIAFVLAVEHLTPGSAPAHNVDLAALRAGAPLLRVPVWLDAKRIAEAAKPGASGALTRAVVEAFADVATLPEEAARAGLEAGRYLLLIDALDEVPTVEERGRVVDALAMLAGVGWPCRFVLTTRPTAHTGAGLPAGAARLEMAALGDEQVQRLAARWCDVRGHNAKHLEALLAAIEGVRERHGAVDIVANPMLLTSLFLVFDEERRLPDSTATLYEKMVDILCAVKSTAPYFPGSPNPCPPSERRAVLERIFEKTQRAGGTEIAVSDVADDLVQWKSTELPTVLVARLFLDSLAERTYMLRFEQRPDAAGRPESFLLARHRSIQEYLSACALANTRDSVEAATDNLFRSDGSRPAPIDDPTWTGALAFLAGVYANQRGDRAQGYVQRLYELAHGEREARVLALVANALGEYERHFRGHDLARDVPGEIVRRFEERGATWPWRDRVLALEALGRLGDPRLQGERWVDIAGGTFTMGGDLTAWNSAPAHKVPVEGFRLSRWPVTVSEYAEFVRAGDYAHECWWEGRPERSEPDDWRQQLRYPNRPVVQVTWLEARAWCRWMTKHKAAPGEVIALPTEEEWEFAPRGHEGRKFPWGEQEPGEDDAARANHDWGSALDSGPGRPTPVGAFPLGHCGLLWDLAGNVWEWTASAWREPEDAAAWQQGDTAWSDDDMFCHHDDTRCREGDTDCREDDNPPGHQSEAARVDLSAAPRVLRGGSWLNVARYLRCATRLGYDPQVRDPDVGFRVVCRRFRQHVGL